METTNNIKQALTEISKSELGQNLINSFSGKKDEIVDNISNKVTETIDSVQKKDEDIFTLSVSFADDVTLFNFTGRSANALQKLLSDLQFQAAHITLDNMSTSRAQEINNFMSNNLNGNDLSIWKSIYAEYIKLINIEGVKIETDLEGTTYVSKAIRDAICEEVARQLRSIGLTSSDDVSSVMKVARSNAENKYRTYIKDGKIFCVARD